LTGAGGLTANGAGTLALSGTGVNTYSGTTTVAGPLRIQKASALGGTAAGTVVQAGAVLAFGADPATGARITVNEPLTLLGELDDLPSVIFSSSINTWAGDIALGAAATARISETALLSGLITGTGNLTKEGTGTLTLGGTSANSYSGTVTVNAGLLELNKPAAAAGAGSAITGPLVINAAEVSLLNDHQISDTAGVTLNEGALWDLGSHQETVAGLTVTAGRITTGAGKTGAGKLTLNGNVTATSAPDRAQAIIDGNLDLGGATRTFTVNDGPASPDLIVRAIISGGTSAGLIKAGAGTLELTAANTYPAATTVTGGRLRVSGSQAGSAVTVSSDGTLEGNGTVGRITTVGGPVRPGTPLSAQGNVQLDANATFLAAVLSPPFQLAVTGKVSLGNAHLLLQPLFTPRSGQQFVLISNDGTDSIGGTFSGIPEGGTVSFPDPFNPLLVQIYRAGTPPTPATTLWPPTSPPARPSKTAA
jgi:autotransporter-associated beta strand protein